MAQPSIATSDLSSYYESRQHALEDFWGRRAADPSCRRKFTLFGLHIDLASNVEELLAAVDYSLPLYSRAAPTEGPQLTVELIARQSPIDVGPAPDNLIQHVQYAGHGAWLAMQFGAWGHCQADLAHGHARAILTPALAARPDLVSAWLLNTLFNNFFTFHGFAMLHASCVLEDGRALLLLAPHNRGKSTTVLRLVLNGYRLLSDSQVYLLGTDRGLQLTGFPVGRVKLRQDRVDEFPDLRPLLIPEQVRGETKYVLDMRQVDAHKVCEEAVLPERIEFCLLTRHDHMETKLRRASREEVLKAAFENSLHYDTKSAWEQNLRLIGQLVDRARLHHLTIGGRPDEILSAIASLWD
ncbi:MAG TPA: hypothetical protein VJ123_07515 [Anaerolineales bacterium]|nr:hypothetical protein [Anaerolineales bacterium]